MLISTEKKFIFVANSKTASTSIELALKPHALALPQETPAKKHRFLETILADHPRIVASLPGGAAAFFKFGVMRDPIDWITSWFRYRQGNKVDAPLPPELSFEDFWALDDWTKWLKPGRKRLQKDFFHAADGRLLADYVVPYAEIDRHFPLICDRLGIAAKLDRVNVSRIASGVTLSPALEAELRDFYREDYAFLDRIGEINAQAIAQSQEP